MPWYQIVLHFIFYYILFHIGHGILYYIIYITYMRMKAWSSTCFLILYEMYRLTKQNFMVHLLFYIFEEKILKHSRFIKEKCTATVRPETAPDFDEHRYWKIASSYYINQLSGTTLNLLNAEWPSISPRTVDLKVVWCTVYRNLQQTV